MSWVYEINFIICAPPIPTPQQRPLWIVNEKKIRHLNHVITKLLVDSTLSLGGLNNTHNDNTFKYEKIEIKKKKEKKEK